MPRALRPNPGETLASFIKRTVKARNTSIPKLARALGDTEANGSWLRMLRRWTSSSRPQRSIQDDPARIVGEALNADLSSFVQQNHSYEDLLTQAIERVATLEKRVAALEER